MVAGLRLGAESDGGLSVLAGDTELFRYEYSPQVAAMESPKPYFHPVRTRGGRVVTDLRPDDHVWHTGLAWAMPNVGDDNFWGGPTYVRGREYVQLANNGTQRHRSLERITVSDGVSFTQGLDWIAQDGHRVFTEERTIGAQLLGASAWALTFHTRLSNVSGSRIIIGSPTTQGRANAGYGGLFWRGPEQFAHGVLVHPEGSGGDELRGSRASWMGYVGGVGVESSLVLMVDDADNSRHPPQWFARTEEYPALNPAPFFSEELPLDEGGSIRFRYGVAIADAGMGEAPDLADAVERILMAGHLQAE